MSGRRCKCPMTCIVCDSSGGGFDEKWLVTADAAERDRPGFVRVAVGAEQASVLLGEVNRMIKQRQETFIGKPFYEGEPRPRWRGTSLLVVLSGIDRDAMYGPPIERQIVRILQYGRISGIQAATDGRVEIPRRSSDTSVLRVGLFPFVGEVAG